jgi:hypothetical protein
MPVVLEKNQGKTMNVVFRHDGTKIESSNGPASATKAHLQCKPICTHQLSMFFPTAAL